MITLKKNENKNRKQFPRNDAAGVNLISHNHTHFFALLVPTDMNLLMMRCIYRTSVYSISWYKGRCECYLLSPQRTMKNDIIFAYLFSDNKLQFTSRRSQRRYGEGKFCAILF